MPFTCRYVPLHATRPLHVVRSIQGSYRAYRARKRFLELREKSMGIFHGKKRRRGSWVFYFLGDYIGAPHSLELDESTDSIVGRPLV